ncbi:MAG TPA: hypothetical protein ENI60_06505 [Candidatus Fraserbacteria bacterium]|nr:hypothetical protein [Candidatus Fraserbacteria bacterium]
MSEIELFQRAAKDSANKELRLMNEYASSLKDDQELKEMPSSIHNMTFNDARTGNTRSYNRTERSYEERSLHILLHKNKQYQWLLAEAYEEFEDFLENAYAFYGSINNSFWPLRDYGSISLSELSEKDYEWHVEQARKKKDIPHSILNRFRKQFPELKVIETKNELKTNLSLAITLIGKLRHIIVHKGGQVDSKDDFIKIVTQQSGLYNNGNIAQENLDFINEFFGENEYSNLITILEVRVRPEIPLDIHVSLFGGLTNFLMAYAFLIYEYIEKNTCAGRNSIGKGGSPKRIRMHCSDG